MEVCACVREGRCVHVGVGVWVEGGLVCGVNVEGSGGEL